MEKMRQKFNLEGGYFDLQKLSRPLRPGVICEDLGRTQYKIGSGRGATRIVKKSNVVPEDVAFDSSDDVIDSFSSKHQASSRATPQVRQILKKNLLPKGMDAVASGSKPNPRPTFKVTKVAHAEENNSLSSPLRPKTRPAFQGAKKRTLCDDHDEMPPSNQLTFNSKRSRKLSSRQDDHCAFPLEELSPNRAKRSKDSREHKLEPPPFPMSEECRDAAFEKKSSPHPAPFPMAVPTPKHSSRKSRPVPFPMPSPPTSCVKAVARAPQRFPVDSPCASPDKHGSDDSEDELNITDKDNGTILTHGGPRPFPMSMSQFLPKLPPVASGAKRSAQDEEDQRSNKKSRPSLPPDNFSSLSLDGDGNVDPSTICPYCDEPWPSAPSPTLTSLLEHTKRKSYSDPRPGNALGLKAPLTVFVELCQRHRFEMTHLPLALARGWPTRLDFASLPKRIGAFRKELGRFVNRPDESQFWREIRDEVKEVGRMKVVSMSGQYATFERTQPGYYGEQGSIIIHQSLYSLCPPDSIPPASVLPLTVDQFLTRVLVPETAVLLIQEDMGLPTKAEAHRVLDESKKYGLAMFPEKAQTKEVADVGEDLARKRARAQRKLLEKWGETDADVKREVQEEQRQARKVNNMEKERAHATRKGNELDIGSELDQENGEEWKKGRRNAKEHSQVPLTKKLTWQVGHHRWDENGDDLMLSESQESTPRRAKVASKPRESSSRQSSHSLSTSLALHVGYKPTSRLSPIHGSNRKLLSSQSRQTDQSSQWVHHITNISRSSDREDVDIGEMIVEDQGYVAETLSSDSDAVVAIEESTSKPKPKPKPRRIIKRAIQNAKSASDADLLNDAAVERTARKPTGKVNHNVGGEGDNRMKGVLGQTKRRKKGKLTSKGTMSSGENNL